GARRPDRALRGGGPPPAAVGGVDAAQRPGVPLQRARARAAPVPVRVLVRARAWPEPARGARGDAALPSPAAGGVPRARPRAHLHGAPRDAELQSPEAPAVLELPEPGGRAPRRSVPLLGGVRDGVDRALPDAALRREGGPPRVVLRVLPRARHGRHARR